MLITVSWIQEKAEFDPESNKKNLKISFRDKHAFACFTIQFNYVNLAAALKRFSLQI